MNLEFYKGKNILVTGNTGFKGSWLSIWLRELGANVIGYSLEPPTKPSNFELSGLNDRMDSIWGDVRDYEKLQGVLERYKPEMIFHLAAQAIVLTAYENPLETLESNVIGTINLLEAVRQTGRTKAVVCITTDKVYENKEWIFGYRESDTLFGTDPYGASKSMAENAIACYRKSFFEKEDIGVASVRAGNVIGGGDFAEHRLVCDTMKALLENKEIVIRNPKSVRPWQFVLEPLSGYLKVGMNLYENPKSGEAWNFGPESREFVDTENLVKKAIELWGNGSYVINEDKEKKEANLLMLNCDKANRILGWKARYSFEEALKETVDWFKEYEKQLKTGNVDMYWMCRKQIERYSL